MHTLHQLVKLPYIYVYVQQHLFLVSQNIRDSNTSAALSSSTGLLFRQLIATINASQPIAWTYM